jgi:hypothetical protein
MKKHMHFFRAGVTAICLVAAGCSSIRTTERATGFAGADARFNSYILKAVELLATERAGLGYGNHALTQDLKFGDQGILPASKHKPLTMCVAAQLEVLVEGLNLYAAETKDFAPFRFLPKKSWESLGPADLRGQIWLVDGANANGAADALKNLGMGGETTFESMVPGDFINFNRTNGKGHGAIFIAYLDRDGNELAQYSDLVEGFRYFSSQGKEVGGGLGYRYAFFHPTCPSALPAGGKRDCGVIRSAHQRQLNTGFAIMPSSWNAKRARAFVAAAAGQPAVEGTFDAEYFTGETTDD